MPKLAHVFASTDVKALLEHAAAPDHLVGILFQRRDPVAGEDPKRLHLDPYWVSYEYDFGTGPTPDPSVSFKRYPLETPTTGARLVPTGEIDLETGGLPPTPSYMEFWGDLTLYSGEFGFAFFSKEMLQGLANKSPDMYLGGALIKSGVVLGETPAFPTDPTDPDATEDPRNWTYFTLKMQAAPTPPVAIAEDDAASDGEEGGDSESETPEPSFEDDGVPKVTIGEPCPPYWEIYSEVAAKVTAQILSGETQRLETEAKCCELNLVTRFLCQILPPALHFIVGLFCRLFSPNYRKAVGLDIAAVVELLEIELLSATSSAWARFCQEILAEMGLSSSNTRKEERKYSKVRE